VDSTQGPGGLYDSFEAYRTVTQADYRHLITNGLVVPDTNVFLNLYRYNEQTRNDLFTVLRGLEDRLWVPRQVMVEFWRNRETVLLDPRDTDKTSKKMVAHRDDAINTFRAWANRVGLPTNRTDELINVLFKAFGEVIEGIGELADDDASYFVADTNKDPVLAGLEPILNGRVGRGLEDTDYKHALEEAKRRADAKRPPGYKDSGRPGDYLIWSETLREAKQRNVDVLIVTGDVKEDWWRQEHGKQRGPRPELAEEMRNFAGARLSMLRPESLLLHAREILQVQVRDESVQDVERVSEAALNPSPSHLTAALKNFRSLGHDVDEDTWEYDDNHRWRWNCRRCGSYLFTDDSGETWVSATGVELCTSADVKLGLVHGICLHPGGEVRGHPSSRTGTRC
jgi:PIN like domain